MTYAALIPSGKLKLRCSIRLIAEATARHFDVSYVDILSARRTAKIVLPRQIAVYLARKHTTLSLPEIGSRLGGRDHTTMLHSCRSIERQMEKPIVHSAIADIELSIAAGLKAIERTGSIVLSDADAFAAAQRILDRDVMRVSVDELRAMAGLIRAYVAPLVEAGEDLDGPTAPEAEANRLVEMTTRATEAWSQWRQAEFTTDEPYKRRAMDQAMASLETTLKEIS